MQSWAITNKPNAGPYHNLAYCHVLSDEAKAEALLRLLDRTIETSENAVVPDDLGDALEQVRKVSRNLARTPEYRRLETAARRARR